jgi:DNA-binding NtrC family response regulator
VDDEFDLMCLWKDALSQIKGFNIFGFTDSPLALEHYKANYSRYSLILSDFRMPSMDGVELLTKVKTINPYVKTILITAFHISDEVFQNCNCIDKFLQKPITMTDLITEVQKQIKAKKELEVVQK